MPLPSIGKRAPSFSMLNAEGEKVALKDYKGQIVVLYFYPKAMTPGCTVQAQNLRDLQKKLEKKGVVTFGVSPDEPNRLAKFVEKESLNFDLLSDPDHSISEKYGVWVKKKLYGREYMGVERTTFIIDESGKLRYVMEKVKAKTHHEDLLKALSEIQSES